MRGRARGLQRDTSNLEIEVDVVRVAHTAEVSANEYVVRAVAKAHETVWGAAPEVTWDGWYPDTAPLTRPPSSLINASTWLRDQCSSEPVTTMLKKAYQDAFRGKDPKHGDWVTYVE